MEKRRKNNFLDVDATVLEPHPQRIRNILTLEERVQVIKAYECRPMYTKIAKMFNCGWEQIKNIIANRDAIMKSYEKTMQSMKHVASKKIDKHERLESDQSNYISELQMRKIKFLGDCMHEYILRLRYMYPDSKLTEDFLCAKARAFRDELKIETFVPNKAWIKHFKSTYNIKSFNEGHIVSTRNPQSSLDFKDIMAYCTKMKIEMHFAHTKTNDLEYERKKLINLLERSLYKFTQRMQSEYKQETTLGTLLKVALRMRDLLKINNLYFDKVWFESFQRKYNVAIATDSKLIHDYLFNDLHDIILHSSENNISAFSTTESTYNQTQPMEIKNEFIELDDDEADEIIKEPVEKKRKLDVGADIETHTLKIQKIESLGINKEQDQWSDDFEEELPKLVRNYSDALKLLKPLEEFAMLEENFRVIGLISQLETIFKNPPNKNEDEEL